MDCSKKGCCTSRVFRCNKLTTAQPVSVWKNSLVLSGPLDAWGCYVKMTTCTSTFLIHFFASEFSSQNVYEHFHTTQTWNVLIRPCFAGRKITKNDEEKVNNELLTSEYRLFLSLPTLAKEQWSLSNFNDNGSDNVAKKIIITVF